MATNPPPAAVKPSAGPISPTSVCGAKRFVTITPTAIAKRSVSRPVMTISACFSAAGLAVVSAIFPSSLSMHSSPHQRLSNSEDDPAEGAALNEVTQSISRFGQREGLGHDRFDRAGLKQRDDSVPGVSPGRLRLSNI